MAEVAGEAIPAEVFRTRYIDYLLQTSLADTSRRRAAFLKRLIRVKLIVQEAKTGGITEAVPYLFEKEGIYRKLLLDLGINTIYFNPIFYARSLHKYDGASFHHIDPYFGPDPDLAMIADEAVVVVINRSDASQRACRWRPKARGSKLFFLPPTMRWA